MQYQRGFRGCGKTPKLSFRGRGLPEESAFFLVLVKKQIPRCARDDKIAHFFRSLFSRWPLPERVSIQALNAVLTEPIPQHHHCPNLAARQLSCFMKRATF